MVSVIATNREWGDTADGTGTRVGTCLINRWRVKINQEGLYNVKTYTPRKRGGKEGTQKRERKDQNIKFHEQDPRITLAHLYTSTMSTTTNHYPVTKA